MTNCPTVGKSPDLMEAKIGKIRRYAERAIEGDITMHGVNGLGEMVIKLLDSLEVFQLEQQTDIYRIPDEQKEEYLEGIEHNQRREIAHYITNKKGLMFERVFQHSPPAPLFKHKAIYVIDASKMDNSDV